MIALRLHSIRRSTDTGYTRGRPPLPAVAGYSGPLVIYYNLDCTQRVHENSFMTESEGSNLVVPDQPWLDGFSIGQGLIRQFVAMPLGEGFSAEEQLTGEGQHGGLQIAVYPMKASVYEAMTRVQHEPDLACYASVMSAPLEMGLAPDGLIRQEIDLRRRVRFQCLGPDGSFPLLCAHSQQRTVLRRDWRRTAQPATYRLGLHECRPAMVRILRRGSDLKVLAGAMALAGLDSVAAMKLKQGKGTLENNDPVQPQNIKKLDNDRVREGDF